MEELQRQINELRVEVERLRSSTTIPYTVDQAFRERLEIKDLSKLINQTDKDASTETRAVNEAGTNSYNVAKPMDGFFLFVKDNTAYYIPYYNLS